ncbi:MAG: hypothetical protein U5K56_19290 [Halioglobus sp.]|nr:hypothetical protein [Halioglobus sp.]
MNVVDLMTLQSREEHPHGLSDRDFDTLFTTDKPIVFAYHGYPWLIHRLTYRRTNHKNLHVRGYKEEGTTTTPFDMTVLNDLDRFHLVVDVIDRVAKLGNRAAALRQFMLENALSTPGTSVPTARTCRKYANGNGLVEKRAEPPRGDRLQGADSYLAGAAIIRVFPHILSLYDTIECVSGK